MAYTLHRPDRVTRTYPLPTGATALSVALLAPHTTPTATTTWTAVTPGASTYPVTLAGPDASPTGAVVVTADADLWQLTTTATGVDAEYVERVCLR